MKQAKATFGGGCFWCMEPPFDGIPGVIQVVPGYMGGMIENPSYEQVCTGHTGHIEVVQVTYDPETVSYQELLNIFWRNIDPTVKNQQFADRGTQYQTVIFYHDSKQKELAEASLKALQSAAKFSGQIQTEILPAAPFYQAEAYHCQYYLKNPAHYERYKEGSGRGPFLRKHWEK